MHIHFDLYKRTSANVYRQMVIDYWENFCAWTNGTSKNLMLDYTIGRAIKNPNLHTNAIHKCPYVGPFYIQSNNLSLDFLAFDFLFPAGVFHLEITLSDKKRGDWIVKLTVYFSVSEHRIEIF